MPECEPRHATPRARRARGVSNWSQLHQRRGAAIRRRARGGYATSWLQERHAAAGQLQHRIRASSRPGDFAAPIVDDRKIVLPHVSRFVRTQPTATAATIRVGELSVRVYSAHLGTMSDLSPAARREQLQAILADAEPYARVVIGGDMNDAGVGRIAREKGYAWPTQRGPQTTFLGRLDHIFLKGLSTPDSGAAGTVLNSKGASDHLPVWAVAVVR